MKLSFINQAQKTKWIERKFLVQHTTWGYVRSSLFAKDVKAFILCAGTASSAKKKRKKNVKSIHKCKQLAIATEHYMHHTEQRKQCQATVTAASKIVKFDNIIMLYSWVLLYIWRPPLRFFSFFVPFFLGSLKLDSNHG